MRTSSGMIVARIRNIFASVPVINRARYHSHKWKFVFTRIAVAHRGMIIALIGHRTRIETRPNWHTWTNVSIRNVGSVHVSIVRTVSSRPNPGRRNW